MKDKKMDSDFYKRRAAYVNELASARRSWFLWVAAAITIGAWTLYGFRFRPELLPDWLSHLLTDGLFKVFSPIKTLGSGEDGGVAAWGQFGDFLGGVLNPIFSFLALLAVVRTLRLQALQLEQSRSDQAAANTAAQITALHSAAEVLTQQITQMQSVSGSRGPVDPELYSRTMKRRDELTRRMLTLAGSLLET